MDIKRLIRENYDAPVDTLIRELFHIGCTDFYDNDDYDKFYSSQEVLEQWYDLDSLDLMFTLPNGKNAFVRLIHQYKMVNPHIEDISDYSMNIESYPTIKDLLTNDSRFALRYTE